MKNKNFGMKVKITYKNGKTDVIHNVTEIHYNYNNGLSNNPQSTLKEVMIAFESDIHQTGYTYRMSEIVEFESLMEKEIAESM